MHVYVKYEYQPRQYTSGLYQAQCLLNTVIYGKGLIAENFVDSRWQRIIGRKGVYVVSLIKIYVIGTINYLWIGVYSTHH